MITTRHCINRAEHALRTGQPGLAETYMRRALQLQAGTTTKKGSN